MRTEEEIIQTIRMVKRTGAVPLVFIVPVARELLLDKPAADEIVPDMLREQALEVMERYRAERPE